MLKELDSFDWEEVFKYGNPKRCDGGHNHRPEAVPTSLVSEASFSREDVKRIIAMAEGESDDASWLGVFELNDGRFVYLTAWCDYTGWG